MFNGGCAFTFTHQSTKCLQELLPSRWPSRQQNTQISVRSLTSCHKNNCNQFGPYLSGHQSLRRWMCSMHTSMWRWKRCNSPATHCESARWSKIIPTEWSRDTYCIRYHTQSKDSFTSQICRPLLATIRQTDALNLWQNYKNCEHHFFLILLVWCSTLVRVSAAGGWAHLCMCQCVGVSVCRCVSVCQHDTCRTWTRRVTVCSGGWITAGRAVVKRRCICQHTAVPVQEHWLR